MKWVLLLSVFVVGVLGYADIEVVFTLDTTGSMAELLAGAKTKIWSIANEIKQGYPKNMIKFGLVGYRDRGDMYVTDITDLSDDFDSVIGTKLNSFEAGGGGDLPESVNEALDHSVHRISWSQDAIKIIFLVGDAPPHMDYSDDVKYLVTCGRALEKDIIINTVLCGNNHETRRVWREIAKTSGGRYVQIDANGGMNDVNTPFDDEISEINEQLRETIIVYGNQEQRENVREKTLYASSMSKEAQAERGVLYDSYRSASSSELIQVVSGKGDLLKDFEDGIINTEDALEESDFNTPESLNEALQSNKAKRKKLQSELSILNSKRANWLKSNTQEHSGFSKEVKKILQSQIPESATKQKDL